MCSSIRWEPGGGLVVLGAEKGEKAECKQLEGNLCISPAGARERGGGKSPLEFGGRNRRRRGNRTLITQEKAKYQRKGVSFLGGTR